MRIPAIATLAAALTVGTALAAATPAMAEMVKMKATLDAAQEVPPNDSTAKGTADVTFDTETKKLDWTIDYSGLTGDATGAHFHGPADAGANADVAVPIEDPKSGAKGSATLTDAQVADLTAGKYYINVHTAAHPDGEIRGQVQKAM
jgi:Cu/Zn superoxide dismutase